MIVWCTITGGDLADDSIGEAKLADDAVGQDQLKSVVNLQILNSSGGVLKQIYWRWCIIRSRISIWERIYYGSKITLKTIVEI